MLKERTETAEKTAKLRYRGAERKIPRLESQLLHTSIEMEQAKRCVLIYSRVVYTALISDPARKMVSKGRSVDPIVGFRSLLTGL